MSKIKNIIKEALLLNNMIEDDIAVIQVNKIFFNVHLFRILVLLLYNFVLQTKMTEKEILDFIMKNFEAIIDIVRTEVEIVLLNFCNIYEEECRYRCRGLSDKRDEGKSPDKDRVRRKTKGIYGRIQDENSR